MTLLDYQSRTESKIFQPPPMLEISGSWIGWAIYLGMSWTWCIGMFLPVLLVRDFGIAGWWIFAIPNVLGAAAMGWIVRSNRSAYEISIHHRHATAWFSFVTIAFHAFFLTWIVPQIFGMSVIVVAPVLLAIFLLPKLSAVNSRAILAAIIFAISLATMMLGMWQHELPFIGGMDVQPSSVDLSSLAAVCVFGFALCPYLDRTFLGARERTRMTSARKAFSVGFGIFFLGMIIFTLLYSRWMLLVRHGSGGAFPALVMAAIGVHLLVQSVFTISIHTNALRGYHTGSLLIVVATLAGFMVYRSTKMSFYEFNHSGETIYRIFMSFYGLLAPAYVWLCMIPGRGKIAPTKRQLVVTAVVVVLASPFYFVAFLLGKMSFAIIGVAIVLIARFAIGSITCFDLTSSKEKPGLVEPGSSAV